MQEPSADVTSEVITDRRAEMFMLPPQSAPALSAQLTHAEHPTFTVLPDLPTPE